MNDRSDIRIYVVRPALQKIGLWSQAAENLIFGTGFVESEYKYVEQIGGGPGFGFWQMEAATHDDIWTNFLSHEPSALCFALREMSGYPRLARPLATALHGNLFYAAAMCRIHYKRVKEPLPSAGDAEAMAAYWKLHYNTPLGAGTIDKAIPYFKQVVRQ